METRAGAPVTVTWRHEIPSLDSFHDTLAPFQRQLAAWGLPPLDFPAVARLYATIMRAGLKPDVAVGNPDLWAWLGRHDAWGLAVSGGERGGLGRMCQDVARGHWWLDPHGESAEVLARAREVLQEWPLERRRRLFDMRVEAWATRLRRRGWRLSPRRLLERVLNAFRADRAYARRRDTSVRGDGGVERQVDIDEHPAAVAPRSDPAEIVSGREDCAALTRAIAALPEREREIIRLRLAGVTQGEIARRLGLTQGRVSQILGRILATFKEVLGGE